MQHPPIRVAAVAVGAALGAGLRWLALDVGGQATADTVLLVVNVAGAAVLGWLTGWPHGLRHPRTTALLGPGVCGGLTTWSGLALPAALRLREGDWEAALGWPALNVALGVLAAAATYHLASRIEPAPPSVEELDW